MTKAYNIIFPKEEGTDIIELKTLHRSTKKNHDFTSKMFEENLVPVEYCNIEGKTTHAIVGG